MILRNKTIVFIATVAWNRNWQRQQEWASRLARYNRVLYVAPYGMTSMGPLTVLKKFRRQKSFSYHHTLDEQSQKNLEHVRLIFAPLRNISWLNALNARWMQRQLKKLGVQDGSETLFWVCNPADTSVALLKRYPRSRVVYDIAMRFGMLPDAPKWILESQAALAQRADAILHDSTAVLQDLPTDTYYKATYVPQGFAAETLSAHPKPDPRVAAIPQPRAVYIGLDTVLDVSLLKKLLAQLPNLHLVMIGDIEPHPFEHERLHWLGPVNLDQKDAYLAGAKVGLIPYLVNDYTAGTFPTKFFEYRALGLPVVSTNLPELQKFPGQVHLATTHAEFIQQVQRAVTEPTTVPRDFLQKHSWDARFLQVEQVLATL